MASSTSLFSKSYGLSIAIVIVLKMSSVHSTSGSRRPYNLNPWEILSDPLFPELWYSRTTNWQIENDSWQLPSYKRLKVNAYRSLWWCFERRAVKVLLAPWCSVHAYVLARNQTTTTLLGLWLLSHFRCFILVLFNLSPCFFFSVFRLPQALP